MTTVKSDHVSNFIKSSKTLESATEKSNIDENPSIPPVLEVFNIIKKLGSGSFSTVYLGSLKSDVTQKYALKHIISTNHPSRTINELNFLKHFGGKGDIIQVLTCVRHVDTVVVVMPLFEHDKFQTYLSDMDNLEIHTYMKHLLQSLSHIHSERVIHRDIKPSNFLYNRKLRKFALIDFGLSQKETKEDSKLNKPLKTKHSNQIRKCQCACKPTVCKVCLARPSQAAPRAGTPGFRAPEVLMKCPVQTTAIDIWSAGVIMLSLLSRVYPVIKPADDLTSLNLIAQILGTHKMVNAAYAVGKKFHCSPEFDAQDLRLFCQSVSNIHSTPPKTSDENVTNTPAPQLAFDLLAGLLDPNPYTRLSADDALNSPYLSNPYK